jgi:hypothetical protein
MAKVVLALQSIFNAAVTENAKRPGFNSDENAIPLKVADYRLGRGPKDTVALQLQASNGIGIVFVLTTQQALDFAGQIDQTARSGPPPPRKPS